MNMKLMIAKPNRRREPQAFIFCGALLAALALAGCGGNETANKMT
jgi:hypothetical protein